jgi:hypothetical protein
MDYRHHRASRDVQVIIVPVPCGGSPEPLRQAKPGPYPRQERGYWRPADKPPRLSKAGASKRLFDAINRQEQAVRAFMSEARRRTA